MSLIVTNNKNLNDVALIIISSEKGDKTTKSEGDFTQIFVGNKLVGVNVFNAQKYFAVENGFHALSEEQIQVFKSRNIVFDYKSHFKIGQIISKDVHPKSETLFVLKVKTDRELQIVTNNPSYEVDSKVIVATEGAIMPSGLMISPSKMMGVETQAMICSETLSKERGEPIIVLGNPGDEFIL